jgi:hypothetical protein
MRIPDPNLNARPKHGVPKRQHVVNLFRPERLYISVSEISPTGRKVGSWQKGSWHSFQMSWWRLLRPYKNSVKNSQYLFGENTNKGENLSKDYKEKSNK